MTKTSKRNHYNQSSKRATNREKINLPFRHDGVLRWRASFVLYIEDWKKIAETHGKRFKNINPANTLVQAQLVGDEYLVEIEAEAIVQG